MQLLTFPFLLNSFPSFFATPLISQQHAALILNKEPPVYDDLVQSGMTPTEAVCLQQMRFYLIDHFDTVKESVPQDIDGVIVLDEGNALNGNEEHDEKVYEKQARPYTPNPS